MDRRDLKEGQEVYVKGRVIHTGDHFDIVLDEGTFIENAIVFNYEKPVVPQFVAEWYEEHKENFDLELWDIIYEHGRGNTTAMSTWIDFTDDALITLVNMHQFGYKIEEVKRYTVKIVAVNQYLVKNPDEGFLGFLQSRLKSKFTRKELEDAGFGEVFNSPLFEVEEV